MRIPLVPAATVVFGLAVIAYPPFIPAHLLYAVTGPPEGMDVEDWRHAVGFYNCLAGGSILLAGVALFGRHHLLPGRFPPPTRLETRIASGVAACCVVAALLAAAGVAGLTVPAIRDITID